MTSNLPPHRLNLAWSATTTIDAMLPTVNEPSSIAKFFGPRSMNLILTLMLMTGLPVYADDAPATQPAKTPVVFIAPFMTDVIAGRDLVNPGRKVIQDRLTNQFISTVDRKKLDSLLKDARFRFNGGLPDIETGIKMGKILGADLLVVGEIVDLERWTHETLGPDGSVIRICHPKEWNPARLITASRLKLRMKIIDIATNQTLYSDTQLVGFKTQAETWEHLSELEAYMVLFPVLKKMTTDAFFTAASTGKPGPGADSSDPVAATTQPAVATSKINADRLNPTIWESVRESAAKPDETNEDWTK